MDNSHGEVCVNANPMDNAGSFVILENSRFLSDSNLKELKDTMLTPGTLDDTTPSDSGVQLLDSESSELMVESITSQSNIDLDEALLKPDEKLSEEPLAEMNTSVCSTFDTENIVYRRRAKKPSAGNKTQKKRVSFHEDILKNTRTDNIHIEHGFITYKSARAAGMPLGAGRYSWCSHSDAEQLYNDKKPENLDNGLVYRNACSDVLEYGNADVYENADEHKLHGHAGVCTCSSSSSNSSFDSDSDNNSNNPDGYIQAKSNSCDCIGQNITNNNVIGETSYFSEPSLDNVHKSVWSKERKPKSSCLKKSGRSTIILEQDLSTRVKSFNVHDMNNIINNSKIIFGSLKSIFSSPLPERGVPEGSEDIQPVWECVPENDGYKEFVAPKPKPFLSKSLDGSKEKNSRKKFIHNVDEQLRRTGEQEKTETEQKLPETPMKQEEATPSTQTPELNKFRSKFIVNCESTVFEHVGVSYSYENEPHLGLGPSEEEQKTAISVSAPLKQTFLSIFNKLKEPAELLMPKPETEPPKAELPPNFSFKPTVVSSPVAKSSAANQKHLASPMKRMNSSRSMFSSNRSDRSFTPDLFNTFGDMERSQRSTTFSDDFDDILTITTDTDRTESDIAMTNACELNNYARPPKATLIKRFLRNITQKKAMELPISQNEFFSRKLKNEKKLFSGELYSKDFKVQSYDLIDNLNAEIAMEIEMSASNSPRFEFIGMEECALGDVSRFDPGVGEISIEIFKSDSFSRLLESQSEQLLKAFKLYTGYSREGHMTPVLVILTNQSLHVVGLKNNKLCNKFILSYSELDVILMGPYGSTVLLCNSDRKMQQVLLAGGPYPADGLVANLELCARKGGFVLPAVGQLTLEHLLPLQITVRQSSVIAPADNWLYYAVINVPSGLLNQTVSVDSNMKGFLMYRRLAEQSGSAKRSWQAGYFVLKTGVIYMFTDSSSRLPTFALALAECQGARRTLNPSRPHCFEVVLKHEVLQLAAPDEYVASEWLQALVQSASGLFEQQEKHKTLGCTLVMTQNSIITLREDFTAPLTEANKTEAPASLPPKTISMEFNNELLNSVTRSPIKTMNTSTPKKSLQTDEKKKETISFCKSLYGSESAAEVLTSAAIREIIGIRISAHSESWWCILEFSCQEMGENADDLVILFASCSEMQRFLRMLEHLWQSIHNDLFPISVCDEDDEISKQCTDLSLDINRSWDQLLSSALGQPLEINAN